MLHSSSRHWGSTVTGGMMTDLSRILGNELTSLAELAPAVGESIRLDVRAPNQKLSARLLGYREPGSLMVSAPKLAPGGAIVHEGTRMSARMMIGNYLCTFETRLVQVQSRPFGYWHLEYPARVESRRLRKETRIPINLSVRVEQDELSLGASAVSAVCRDISLQGANLESSRALAQPEEQLFITLRVSVAGMDHLLLLPALVRNVQQLETGPVPVFSQGVEFVDLEEDTRLILAGFVYEQQLQNAGLIE